MKEQEIKQVNGIRESYAEKTAAQSDIEKLIALDRKAKRPAEIFSYIFGTAGALVLGVGMCLAMGVIGEALPMAVGIVIGCAGILMASINYPIYKKILKSGKEKYGPEIMRLSEKLLND